jgi:dihydrofolate reductase
MKLSMIVAIGPDNIIGIDGKLPWHIPEDLKRFRRLTEGHTVVMGRGTFESIGGKRFHNRFNMVLSRTHIPEDLLMGQILHCKSVQEALEFIAIVSPPDKEVFVIGGPSIYAEFAPHITKVYLTTVKNCNIPADLGTIVRFAVPQELRDRLVPTRSEDYPDHTFSVWEQPR